MKYRVTALIAKFGLLGTFWLVQLPVSAQPAPGACAYGPDTCLYGYVWRDAVSGDHVCVLPQTRADVAYDNSQAAQRRAPSPPANQPDICQFGYVWREATSADHVCVVPATRTATATDNQLAPTRRDPQCAPPPAAPPPLLGPGPGSPPILLPSPQPPSTNPTSVQVTGTPTTATIRWTVAAPSGTRPTINRGPPVVIVERRLTGVAPVRLNVPSQSATEVIDSGPLVPGQTVTYRVTITDTFGTTGWKEAVFTPPVPRDPGSLTATAANDGSVTLTWPTVDGADGYQISGTALPSPVVVRYAHEWRSPPRQFGVQEWKVASIYPPGGRALTPAANWPAATSRVTPPPGKMFLTLPNGVGTQAESEAHYRTQCSGLFVTLDNCTAAGMINDVTNWEDVWNCMIRNGWRYGSGKPCPHELWQRSTAVFNSFDLGVWRLLNCAPRRNGRIVCWATNHDQEPSDAWDGVPLHTPTPKSLSVIVMFDDGSAFFGSWALAGSGPPIEDADYRWIGKGKDVFGADPPFPFKNKFQGALDLEHSFVKHSVVAYGSQFDNQGRKTVPHACLSCHGGRYDAATHRVIGASLLPVNPSRVVFGHLQTADPAWKSINQIVANSRSAPAIAQQIVSFASASVPPGWGGQADLYKQIIEPYCSSCHFAQRGPLSFSSFADLVQNRQAVQRAVCTQFTMPHSETLFKKFWSDGGASSLPSQLSKALGFSRCPDV